MPQLQTERTAVDAVFERRMHPQGLQFGTKHEDRAATLPLPAVIQRLFADAVARQGQGGSLPVPYRHGEHADGAHQRFADAPGIEACQQGFSIRMTAPCRRQATFFQLLAQQQMVIYFTIESDDITASGRRHGLMAGRRQVDDGQATVPEADTLLCIAPIAFIIRAAKGNGVRHALEQGNIYATIMRNRRAEETYKSTHQ